MNKNIIGFLNLYNSPELGPLTEKRTLGSTSFLGRFALMDFSLSNFTNSGIDNINVLVKNNFRSVSKHVRSLRTWVNNTKKGHQNILINEKGLSYGSNNTDINCLIENDWVFFDTNADIVVITPAHIITRMDFRPIIEAHVKANSPISIVYKNINDANESFLQCNTLAIKDGEVVSFAINDGKKKNALVSLQTYILNKDVLKDFLNNKKYKECTSLKGIIEYVIKNKVYKIKPYEYIGYARCFDSLKHFVEYSFELLDFNISSTLFGSVRDNKWPIFTQTHNSQPTLYGENAVVKNSFIANGAKIEGQVENSIISRGVNIAKGAVVKNSIILASTNIEANCEINNAVIDKYARICQNVKINGKENEPIYVEQGKQIK